MSELRTYQRKVARLISTEIEETSSLPVSIQDAKNYARIDTDVEDSIVDILIQSARKEFETFTGKLFFKRAVTATFGCEGDSLVILPYLPVVSVTSVKKGGDDIDYDLKGDRLHINTVGEVEIIYQCGLFDGYVEPEAQLGVLKYVTSNYEDRQDVAAMGVTMMPNNSRKHWIKYKNFSL